MNIKLIAKISKFDLKKLKANKRIKNALIYRKASLPSEFNSEDQEWVDFINDELPSNERIQTPSDLEKFQFIVSYDFFAFFKKYIDNKDSTVHKKLYKTFEEIGSKISVLDEASKELMILQIKEKFDLDFDLYHLDSFSDSDEGITVEAVGLLSNKEVCYPVRLGVLIPNSKIEVAKEMALEIQQKLIDCFEFYQARKEVVENILNEKETESKSYEERLTEIDKQFLREVQDTELFKKTFNEIKQEFIDQMSKCKDLDETGKNKCLEEVTKPFLSFDIDIWITKATLHKLKQDKAPVPKWLTAKLKVKRVSKDK